MPGLMRWFSRQKPLLCMHEDPSFISGTLKVAEENELHRMFFDLHLHHGSLSPSPPARFLHNIFTTLGKGTLKIFILGVNMIILTKHILYVIWS